MPVEIRKRKFSRKTWPLYRRVLMGGIATIVSGLALYQAGHYFLLSPGVRVGGGDQSESRGKRFVPPGAIVEKFSADMHRSVVRVPLAERRKALESLPWVEHAHVQRVLPNRIRVEITERTPVAFLRGANELALMDVYGMILERPVEGEFRSPVVSGVGESMSRDVRGQRMRLFVQFMPALEQARPGAAARVRRPGLSAAPDS